MAPKSREELIADLGKPFPKSAIKRHPKKGFSYIEGHTVINRLNSATDNAWDFEVKSLQFDPVGVDKNGQPITKVLAHVAITIEGLGRREHIGVQTVYVSGEDLVKGAITDALKKCATLFGPGIELYGDDYEAEASAPTQNANAPQKGNQPPAKPTPSNGGDKPITPAAMKRIHALMSEIGLDHSHLTAYAIDQGHQSSKELTMEQVTKLGNGIKEKPEAVAKYLTDLLNKIELQQAGMEVGQQFDAMKAGQ